MRNLFIVFFLVFLLINNNAQAKPKVVPTSENIFINEGKNSPPIGLAKLVFNIPNTKNLGRGGIKTLLGCGDRYPFQLEKNTFNVQNSIFINTFVDVIKEANYNLPSDPNALFDDKNNKPEFLIAATITDFDIDYCVGTRTEKGDGQLYMKLDWQVYNIAKKEVVFRKETEGYHKLTKLTDNPLFKLLDGTFKSALYNLLETDELAKNITDDSQVAVDPEFDNVGINYMPADPDTRDISIAEARQSVVTIKLPTGGHGSGFIISEKGHILTNEHVVAGNDHVLVVFENGIEIEGEVIRTAVMRDVALVKIPLSRSKPLALELQEPEIGATVYTIGSPLNTGFSGTVSQGIISSFRLMDDQEYIQSDALINGGNSGGPMIDEKGNVVAISVSGRTDGEGVNFFIPINFALRALNISLPGKTASKYVSED